MLRWGARTRVRKAIEPHLLPGERLKASALAYIVGSGDYAVGLTEDRLIFVRVSKLTGKPTGEKSSDQLSRLRADPRMRRPFYVERFSVRILTLKRSTGEEMKLRFDSMWWAQAGEILEALQEPS
jgi:hypothetical protein